jgi:lipopolysaccharide exporter
VKPDDAQTRENEGHPSTNLQDVDRRILRSVGWVSFSRAGQSAVSALSLLVLARLLDPKAFGLVALAGSILVVLQFLQQSGLGGALIYRRYGVEEAAGSVLIYSTLAGTFLCLCLVFASPFVAQAFHQPEAKNVVRVLAILLVIRGVAVAPTAVLEREMNFRARAAGDASSAVVQAVVSISLAFAGLGVWSLVFGSLVGAGIQTGVSWYMAPIHPSPRHARWSVLRELLGYGRFLTAGNIVTLVTRNLDNFVVARILGATTLGVYAIAFRLATLPAGIFVSVVGRVMFPAYTLLRDDVPAFRRAFVQNMQRIALLAIPCSVFLSVAADPLVVGLLGAKWEAAVDPLRILALYAVILSLSSPCGAVYQAAGKPHLVPLLALPMLVVMVPALILLTRGYGPTGAALAMLISMICSGVPAIWVATRILELRAVELGRALSPAVLCSTLLAAALLAVLAVSDGVAPLPRIVGLAAVAVIAYVGAIAFFARETVAHVWVGIRRSRPREVQST